MYKDKNIKNYYLQTMGINPWVLRDTPQQEFVIHMENIKFNPNEQALLDRMLQSVGLDSSNVCIQQAKEGVDILSHPGYLLVNPLEKRKAYAALGRCFSAD